MRLTALFIIVLSLFLINCEEDINPLNTEETNYSMYGHIDMSTDLTAVRVNDLEAYLNDPSRVNEDLILEMTNERTGSSFLLDRQVTQFDGITVQNFVTSELLERGTEYTVTLFEGTEEIFDISATTPGLSDIRRRPGPLNCFNTIVFDIGPIDRTVSDPEVVEAVVSVNLGNNLQPLNLGYNLRTYFNDNYIIAFSINRLLRETLDLAFPGITCEELADGIITLNYRHFGRDGSSSTLGTTNESGIEFDNRRLVATFDSTITFEVQRDN